MSSNDSSKLFRKRTWLDWLRFSGASVTITANPWHWQWWPQIQNEPLDTWIGPNEHRFYVSWLMLTVRVWVDDGAW
jgi:hypothetical protein